MAAASDKRNLLCGTGKAALAEEQKLGDYATSNCCYKAVAQAIQLLLLVVDGDKRS